MDFLQKDLETVCVYCTLTLLTSGQTCCTSHGWLSPSTHQAVVACLPACRWRERQTLAAVDDGTQLAPLSQLPRGEGAGATRLWGLMFGTQARLMHDGDASSSSSTQAKCLHTCCSNTKYYHHAYLHAAHGMVHLPNGILY